MTDAAGKSGKPLARRDRRRLAISTLIVVLGAGLLGGCADGGPFGFLNRDNGSPRVARAGEEIRPGGGYSMVGQPYQIRGRWYYPKDEPNYRATGVASWYGEDFHGRLTANGEVYNMAALTAAHPTLPLPSYARVTNLTNGRSVVVRINDRGPFAEGRVIDLSQRAARLLGYENAGVARVEVDYIGRAPLDGLDENVLMASYVDPEASTSSGQLGVAADTMLASAAGVTPTVPQARPTTMVAFAPAETAARAPLPPPSPAPVPSIPAGAFTTYFDPIAPLIDGNAYLPREAPRFGTSEAQAAIEAFAPAGASLGAIVPRE